MFILKRQYEQLVERASELAEKVKNLENKVEQLERNVTTDTYDFGKVGLKELCRQLPYYIDERIAQNDLAKARFNAEQVKNNGTKRKYMERKR